MYFLKKNLLNAPVEPAHSSGKRRREKHANLEEQKKEKEAKKSKNF